MTTSHPCRRDGCPNTIIVLPLGTKQGKGNNLWHCSNECKRFTKNERNRERMRRLYVPTDGRGGRPQDRTTGVAL